MKKAFDQTVRDLKREVNKKVLKVPRIEQKVLDATSNEPWGPHGSLLSEIAHATRNYAEFQIIMSILWKRINDTGKNWRHVYKGLTVLEYLVAHGSEKVIDEIREHSYQIATLSEFQYLSSSGRDEGNNVRKKSQNLVALVNDKERIHELRQKAHANRDKYRGSFLPGYGNQYEDDHYHASYESRDDHRNGNGRDRDYSGYRDDEKYGRRDPYSRDGDDYRGRGNDDYQFGSRNRNLDKGRSFDEDDQYSSRSGGRRMDEPSQDDRKQEQNHDAPPSYEEAIRESHNQSLSKKDGGPDKIPVAPATANVPATAASNPLPSESVNLARVPPVGSLQKEEIDAFDEFDPRGSSAASQPQTDFFGLSEVESISALALVPVSAPAPSGEELFPKNSESIAVQTLSSPFGGFDQSGENPFGEPAFKAVPTPQDTNKATIQQQPSLSSAPFAPGDTVDSFAASHNSFVNVQNLSSSLPPGLDGLDITFETNPNASHTHSVLSSSNNTVLQTYPSSFVPQGQVHPSSYPYPAPAVPLSFAQETFSQTPQAPVAQIGTPPLSSGSVGPLPLQPFSQIPQSPFIQTPAAPFSSAVVGPLPPQPFLQTPQAQTMKSTAVTSSSTSRGTMVLQPKDKFETKSTVWADTLSRGLVDLNISGPKTNPLADIGVDFDSINRKEKRKDKEKVTSAPVSTINMGKAMGAGSGMGRASAAGLAPPPNPMIAPGMGMNHPMGMGIGGYNGAITQQPMGINMGMGMNMAMGMNMGMAINNGISVVSIPPSGMPSTQNRQVNNGYNPMTGVGGFGPQVYGGYR